MKEQEPKPQPQAPKAIEPIEKEGFDSLEIPDTGENPKNTGVPVDTESPGARLSRRYYGEDK